MKTDHEIQRDVIDELGWEPSLNATEIGVSVHNGIVTLSGYVRFYAQKMAAENAAKRVKGVKAVAEDILVILADGKPSDTQIAESIVRAFEWNSMIPEDKIKVKVEEAWVTVEGEVHWLYQKDAVSDAINCLTGVKGVSNFIKVRPKLNTIIIKENIKKALERHADLEAERIKIDTVGSKVILRGTARSWSERKEVERAVASAPGVTEVDDRIAVIY